MVQANPRVPEVSLYIGSSHQYPSPAMLYLIWGEYERTPFIPPGLVGKKPLCSGRNLDARDLLWGSPIARYGARGSRKVRIPVTLRC